MQTVRSIYMVTPFFSDIRPIILSALKGATHEILVAVYWFTNQELFDILCQKQEEGTKVELIIHNDCINNRDTGLAFQQFIDRGGQFFFSNADNPMHNKFCVIDESILINGSYNWTYYAENKNSENILLIEGEGSVIKSFKDEFHSLKQKLQRIEKVERISLYELEEFNSMGAKEYLANDLIYQAKATGRKDLVATAFSLTPGNIKVQKVASSLNLTEKLKTTSSLGVSTQGDKYLIIIPKGTSIPVSMSAIVVTVTDDQVSMASTIYFGENEKASVNSPIKSTLLSGIPKKPKGQAQMKYVFSIDTYGMLRIDTYSLDNGVSIRETIDIKKLLLKS